jgi:hypothetical protein
MGRFVDLLAEIATEADEGLDGLTLSPDAWDRFRADWKDEDIEDALTLVRENLIHIELTDAADSLSARLVEVLGRFGSLAAYREAERGNARISLDVISQLARRVDRLEELLEAFRDGAPPDRRGFDALQSHLANLGIETEMQDPEQPEVSGEDEEE